MYEFDDHEGHHVHSTLFGPPFEHKKKITCPACISAIAAFRQKLCDKYGWSEWPEQLSSM